LTLYLAFSLDFTHNYRHNYFKSKLGSHLGDRMNTNEFDKHAKDNLSFYEGFLNFSKYVIAAIIVTLIAMAYFLL